LAGVCIVVGLAANLMDSNIAIFSLNHTGYKEFMKKIRSFSMGDRVTGVGGYCAATTC
jgi:hypothetical protein